MARLGSTPAWRPAAALEIDAHAAERHTFGYEERALQRGVPVDLGNRDATTGRDHPVPRNVGAMRQCVQRISRQTWLPFESRQGGDAPIGCDPAAWDAADHGPDAGMRQGLGTSRAAAMHASS